MISTYKIGDIVKIVANPEPSYEQFGLVGSLGKIDSVYGRGATYGVCMLNGVQNPDSSHGLFYFNSQDIEPSCIPNSVLTLKSRSGKQQIDGNIWYLPEEIKLLKCNPGIKRVIFNGPATIILWANGEKTIVKCQNGDTYDREKGFAMAFMKYVCGNQGNYNNLIKKYVGEDKNEK